MKNPLFASIDFRAFLQYAVHYSVPSIYLGGLYVYERRVYGL